MDSPSSSSMLNYCYHEFFADGDGSTDEEVEQEAVTGACKLAMRYAEHCRRPQAKKGKRGYIERDRRGAHDRLMKDYFDEEPTYSNEMFRRRFRMSKRLFLRIVHDLEANYDFFKQKADARGELGFTGIQKCTSALRILAYGNTTDINDEYLKMGEKTTRDSLEHFCRGIIDVYGARYLRTPTWDDLQKIYEVHNAEHGLPGMIGSIDCMHWRWDNCPTAWRGQHTRGDQKGPTIILQAVASQDLWVWSAYFGVVGSCNDINVFEQSPLLEEWISGKAPKASFYANGNYYPHGYYLSDGIYPRYSIFVKTYSDPIDEKRAYFKKVQESSRKDIERCFGVLKQRWHYLRNPCRAWSKQKMRDAMYACIIMHNMILEDEGKAICQNYVPEAVQEEHPQASMEERVNNTRELRYEPYHSQLMVDLLHHAWSVRYVPPEGEEETEDEGEESEDEN
ncbi:putative harbinger transposase-derived protein [Helianthus annuus]|nr:putative harbinger transposase-derived protein [Helianthus annuus]